MPSHALWMIHFPKLISIRKLVRPPYIQSTFQVPIYLAHSFPSQWIQCHWSAQEHYSFNYAFCIPKSNNILAISAEGMPESLTPQIRTEYHTNKLEATFLYKCIVVEIETHFVTSVFMLCQLLQTCENDSTAQRVTHQGDWPISHQRTHY